jgi:tetratricopeptide (TPR) repeat protein
MSVAHDSAKSIFLAAAERPAGPDREAFLATTCGEDTDLRREVDELLLHHGEVGSFLETPHDGPGAETMPPVEAVGTTIGRYELAERIGEGGMGEVWLARQSDPVKRSVALKVIKAGMDTRSVLARFEAERQALALMDHPNIAKVLDAGATELGRPFFVMELVQGTPITRYCDEHRLTPRERLGLFVPVCQAVQHAHQKGVIHRDLKPSNVLVADYDRKPVPKVIDFGVAKAAGDPLTEKTLVTGFGTIVGTPEYMAPEQAELDQLDVDTRSDIYSLGVLLYELLAGNPPFSRVELERGGVLEMLRMIREREPVPPSTKLSTADGLPTLAANRGTEAARLTRLVRGELDWIVMKALEKDRNRRYETAAGFAQDVQRYLADEPVQAGRPGAGYRVRKFIRRNRTTMVIAGLAATMLLVLTGALGWAARDRAGRHGRNAEAAAALLDQCESALRTDQAERAEVALGAAERRMAEGGAEHLTARLDRYRVDLGLLRALDAIDDIRWTWSEGRYPSGKDLAAQWRAALTAHGLPLDDGRAEDAAAWVNTSSVRDRVLTALDSCLATDPTAAVLAVLRAADPDPYRDAVRDILASGKHKDVVPLAERPEALHQPPRFAAVLGQLQVVTSDRKRAVLKSALRGRTGDLGLLMILGAYPSSRRDGPGERARWFQAALAAHPGNRAILNNLGTALLDLGDTDGAIECCRDAILLDPTFALAHANLGSALLAKGDTDAAIRSFREAIRLNQKLVSPHAGLGKALRVKRDLDGAIASYREAIRLSSEDAIIRCRLGAILWEDKRDFDGAETEFSAAIRINPEHADAYTGLGVALLGKRDTDGALAAFDKSIRLDPYDAPVRNNLAWLLAAGPARVRNGTQAVAHATLACELTRWKNPNCLSTLGVAWAEAGDFDKATEYQKKALAYPAYEKQHGTTARQALSLFARKIPYRDPDLAPLKTDPAPAAKPKPRDGAGAPGEPAKNR